MISSKHSSPQFQRILFSDEETCLKRIQEIDNEAKECFSETVLQMTAFNGLYYVANLLCRNGAALDEINVEGNTPLHVATMRNNPMIVKTLLDYKADASKKNQRGLTPLQIAIAQQYKLTIYFLLSHVNEFISSVNSVIGANYRNRDNETLLHYAASYGCIKIVKTLVESGANVNEANIRNETPLHWAAATGQISIVGYLINNNACVDTLTSEKCTPLHYAVDMGNLYSTSCNSFSFSSLKLRLSYVKVIKLLLKKKALINARDHKGRTPLHYAVTLRTRLNPIFSDSTFKTEESIRREIVECLLDHGANPNSVCHKDLTPIYYAIKENQEDIIRILVSRGANVNYNSKTLSLPLFEAIKNNNVKMVNILLECGADINTKNYSGDTVFEHAYEASCDYEIFEAVMIRATNVRTAIKLIEGNSTDSDILVSSLVAKKVIGELSIDDINFEVAHTSTDIREKFMKCEMEILEMKEMNISNLNLSFFDILVKPVSKLTNFVRNEKVLEVFKSDFIKEHFPISAYLLTMRFEHAREKSLLIDSSVDAFRNLIFDLHGICLPEIVIYKILQFLFHSNETLINLTKVLESEILKAPSVEINDVAT